MNNIHNIYYSIIPIRLITVDNIITSISVGVRDIKLTVYDYS